MSSFFKKLNLEGPDPLDPKPSSEESASLEDAPIKQAPEKQEPLLNGGIEDYLKISPATEDQEQEKPKKRQRKTNKIEKKPEETENTEITEEGPKKIKAKKIESKIETNTKEDTKETKTASRWPEQEGQLATDVYQTEDELVIQTTIAGVRPENLDITAQGDIVIIRGKRDNPNKEEKNYFYKECYWGAFSREIILPAEADTARAEAIMQDGVLTIRMPKIERDKKSKIEVR